MSDTLRISQLTQEGYSKILPNSFFMLFLFLFLKKQFVNLQPFLVMILIKCYLSIIFIILIIFIVYLFDLCYVQPISSIRNWQPTLDVLVVFLLISCSLLFTHHFNYVLGCFTSRYYNIFFCFSTCHIWLSHDMLNVFNFTLGHYYCI